jgi:hypothetical protein
MSNVTEQFALNNGFTVIEAQRVFADTPPAQIPAVPNTNKIIIQVEAVSTRPVYLGNSAITAAEEGLCINPEVPVFDGAAVAVRNTPRPYEILTDTPEDFYLFASGATDVKVLYLKLNTP